MGEPTPQDRIASVQKQAEGVALGEKIAEISSETSDVAGWLVAAHGGPVGLATHAAGYFGSQFGEWLAEKTDSAKHLANALERLGMDRIGQPGPNGPNPGTVGDQVAHSHALLGFLGGLVIGAIAAVAVGALIVATGGAAAVVLIGAAAAGGVAGGFATTTLVGALSQFGYHVGPIDTGSPDVYIEGRAVARMTDVALCSEHVPPPPPIIEGSETIFVNGLPLARVGHKLLCGAVIDQGAKSVVVDSTTCAIAQPASEIPVWLRVTLDWIDFLPGVNKPKKTNIDAPKPKPHAAIDAPKPKPKPRADVDAPKTKPRTDVDAPKTKPRTAPPKPPKPATTPPKKSKPNNTSTKQKPSTTPKKSKTAKQKEWQAQKDALSQKGIDDFRNSTKDMSAPKRGAAFESWVKKNRPDMYGEGRKKFSDGTSTDGWVNSVKKQAWDHKHYKPEQLNKKFSGHAKQQLDAYAAKKASGEIKEFNYVFSDKPSPALVNQIQQAGGNVYYIDSSGNPVLMGAP